MELIYNKYKDKGFEVLAFPANNFGKQEPGSNSEIKACCAKKKVTFDLFAKISVKGDDQCALYKFLTKHPNKEISGEVAWNFQKYLVGRDGKVITKYGPRTAPAGKDTSKFQCTTGELAIDAAVTGDFKIQQGTLVINENVTTTDKMQLQTVSGSKPVIRVAQGKYASFDSD